MSSKYPSTKYTKITKGHFAKDRLVAIITKNVTKIGRSHRLPDVLFIVLVPGRP